MNVLQWRYPFADPESRRRANPMAKQIFFQLVDDLDDKEIPDGTGENITFSVNGNEYEIDLSDKNAKEFHRKLDYYIGYSTKVGGRKARKSTKAEATARSTGAPKSPPAAASQQRSKKRSTPHTEWRSTPLARSELRPGIC
jgi:hypothetical protein